MTYEQAVTKAKKIYPAVDTVAEYEDAYVFYNSKAKGNDLEDNEVVVLKDNGKVVSMTEYAVNTNSNKSPKIRGI